MAMACAGEAALLRIAELTRAAHDARRGCHRRLLLDGPEEQAGRKVIRGLGCILSKMKQPALREGGGGGGSCRMLLRRKWEGAEGRVARDCWGMGREDARGIGTERGAVTAESKRSSGNHLWPCAAAAAVIISVRHLAKRALHAGAEALEISHSTRISSCFRCSRRFQDEARR